MTDPVVDDKTPAAGDLTQLMNKIAALSADLTQAQATLGERDTKIKELEGATGGLKTANGQATARVTTLEGELATAQAALTAQAGELTNWTTKFGQLTDTHTALGVQSAADKKQLELFNLVAGKPEFHGLVGEVAGLVGVVKADAPIADIEKLLTTMATGRRADAAAQLEAYRAGATVPAATIPGAATGGSLPTDPKAAHAEYQSLTGATLPAEIARRAALFEVIVASGAGEVTRQQN